MHRIPRSLIGIAVALALLLMPTGALGAAPAPTVRLKADVPYAKLSSGKVLTYDSFRTHSTGLRPTVILIHGGGWWRGSKTDLTTKLPLAQYFARRGYVAISADYRLSCGTPAVPRTIFGFTYNTRSARCGGTLEGQVADLHLLVRHVRGHARRLGVDPNRIAFVGMSAGGHLGLIAAARADSSERVQAVVNFSGPASTDFVVAQNPRPTIVALNIRAPLTNAIGCVIEVCPTRWRNASADQLIDENTEPFAVLSVAGKDESQAPYSSYQPFDDHLEALGWRSEMLAGAGRCHGAKCLRGRRGPGILKRTAAFLDTALR